MKKFSFSIYNSGQSLVEAVIALSALLLVLSAIAIVTITGLSNTIFLQNQNLANKYAQDGIEYIRNIKINNSAITVDGSNKTFNNLLNNYCMDLTNTLTTIGAGLTSCSNVNLGGTFIRNVNVDPANNDCGTPGPPIIIGRKVEVIVKWTSNKCSPLNPYCHQVNLSTCFTDRALSL